MDSRGTHGAQRGELIRDYGPGAVALVCVLILAVGFPRISRALVSFVLSGQFSCGPIVPSLMEVSKSAPDEEVQRPLVRKRPLYDPDTESRYEEPIILARGYLGEPSLSLFYLVSCRELPRSHPSDADGVVSSSA